MSLAEVLDTYGAAWNANDPEERRALLEKSWANGGVYVDPTAQVTGLEALVDHIGSTREAFGDYRIDRTSGYDEHHGYVRFTWRMTGADGSELVDGFDVVQLAPEGKVATVIGFFGAFPAS